MEFQGVHGARIRRIACWGLFGLLLCAKSGFAQPDTGFNFIDGGEFWVVSTRGCPTSGRPLPARYLAVTHVVSGQACESNWDEFVSSLREDEAVCLTIHGSFLSWETSWADACNTTKWIRPHVPSQRTRMVYFLWPSDGTHDIFAGIRANLLGWRAEHQGLYLAEVIHGIPVAHPICILAHSHGSRVAAAGLHVLGGGIVQGCCLKIPVDRHRIRLVLVAAAIDSHWLCDGERYGNVSRVIECMLNVTNPQDFALRAYRLSKLTLEPSLGQWGISEHGRLAPHIAECDVQFKLGMDHLWAQYIEKPELAATIAPYLLFD